jgi:MerR family transcriptional regulator, light-induced transcriptional regulator
MVRNLFSSEQHGREREVQALDGHDGKKYVAGVAALAIAKIAKKSFAALDVSHSEVKALTLMALDARGDAVEGFVANVVKRGVPVEQVYLQLLAPALKSLGKMWETDETSFSRVALACAKLQRVVFMLEEMPPEWVARRSLDQQVRALGNDAAQKVGKLFLAAVPGSQHTFGVQILADIFRKNGWYVEVLTKATEAQILKALRRTKFDVAGFSVGSELSLPSLRAIVTGIRASAVNTLVPVMVGGAVFAEDVGAQRGLDVEYVCGDAMDAVKWANASFHGYGLTAASAD